MSAHGRILLSTAADRTLRTWDMQDGTAMHVYDLPGRPQCATSWMHFAPSVMTGAADAVAAAARDPFAAAEAGEGLNWNMGNSVNNHIGGANGGANGDKVRVSAAVGLWDGTICIATWESSGRCWSGQQEEERTTPASSSLPSSASTPTTMKKKKKTWLVLVDRQCVAAHDGPVSCIVVLPQHASGTATAVGRAATSNATQTDRALQCFGLGGAIVLVSCGLYDGRVCIFAEEEDDDDDATNDALNSDGSAWGKASGDGGGGGWKQHHRGRVGPAPAPKTKRGLSSHPYVSSVGDAGNEDEDAYEYGWRWSSAGRDGRGLTRRSSRLSTTAGQWKVANVFDSRPFVSGELRAVCYEPVTRQLLVVDGGGQSGGGGGGRVIGFHVNLAFSVWGQVGSPVVYDFASATSFGTTDVDATTQAPRRRQQQQHRRNHRRQRKWSCPCSVGDCQRFAEATGACTSFGSYAVLLVLSYLQLACVAHGALGARGGAGANADSTALGDNTACVRACERACVRACISCVATPCLRSAVRTVIGCTKRDRTCCPRARVFVRGCACVRACVRVCVRIGSLHGPCRHLEFRHYRTPLGRRCCRFCGWSRRRFAFSIRR